MKTIILASRSPDRSEILNRSKIPFEILITNINEDEYKNKISDPNELVKELAKVKALDAKDRLEKDNMDAIIIAADTLVEMNGEIIGKAKDEKEAFQTLKKLMGNTHNLITGIAITETFNPKIIIDNDKTDVKFVNLSDNEIWAYIKLNEWQGRAGSYSIRERASFFIESIYGSWSNVAGLPLQKVFKIMENDFNINLLKIKKF